MISLIFADLNKTLNNFVPPLYLVDGKRTRLNNIISSELPYDMVAEAASLQLRVSQLNLYLLDSFILLHTVLKNFRQLRSSFDNPQVLKQRSYVMLSVNTSSSKVKSFFVLPLLTLWHSHSLQREHPIPDSNLWLLSIMAQHMKLNRAGCWTVELKDSGDHLGGGIHTG